MPSEWKEGTNKFLHCSVSPLNIFFRWHFLYYGLEQWDIIVLRASLRLYVCFSLKNFTIIALMCSVYMCVVFTNNFCSLKRNFSKFFFFLREFHNLWHLLLIIALYYQTKTPISFLCKWGRTPDPIFNHRKFYQLS